MFIGIDQSLGAKTKPNSGTGVCVFVPELGHTAYSSTLIRPHKEANGIERVACIRDHLATYLEDIKTTTILAAMEGYAFGGAGRVFQLGEIGGMVRLLLHDLAIPFIVVPPTALKKWVTGRGVGDKAVIMAHLRDQFGMLFPNDNEADAYALALMASVYHGTWNPNHKTKGLEKARLEVMRDLHKDPLGLLSRRQKDLLV